MSKVAPEMIKSIFALAAVIIIAGCATPASQQSMTVGIQEVPTGVNPKLRGAMAVAVVYGGKATSPLWTSQVDDQNFKGALEQSLTAVGYRSQDPTSAKYTIKATLQELDQPLIEITFDVKSTILYTVTEKYDTKLFPITAIGSATMSDSFIGFERLRIANEKSIKENLRQFIQKISDSYK
jgi:uncharacterized lipoprotein YajG